MITQGKKHTINAVVTKSQIMGILRDHKFGGIFTPELIFPAGTKITRSAMEAARGRIKITIKPPVEYIVTEVSENGIKVTAHKTEQVKRFLSERAAAAGAAGSGDCKRRGNSKYYSELAKKKFENHPYNRGNA